MILACNMYEIVGYLDWYRIDMLNDFMLVGETWFCTTTFMIISNNKKNVTKLQKMLHLVTLHQMLGISYVTNDF